MRQKLAGATNLPCSVAQGVGAGIGIQPGILIINWRQVPGCGLCVERVASRQMPSTRLGCPHAGSLASMTLRILCGDC